MKRRILHVFGPASVMAVILTVSCSRDPDAVDEVGTMEDGHGVGRPDAVAVRERGAALAGEALGVLSANLQAAMAEGGPAHAVQFCSEKAAPLTASVAADRGIGLKRVSHRARNPGNRATDDERAILDGFADAIEGGGGAEPEVVVRDDGSATFYGPILLFSPLCLTCHGDPETEMDAGAREMISALYPGDAATGFSVGDLRGMWRIDFAAGSLSGEDAAAP